MRTEAPFVRKTKAFRILPGSTKWYFANAMALDFFVIFIFIYSLGCSPVKPIIKSENFVS